MLNERHSSRIWKTPRKTSSNGAPVGDRLWTFGQPWCSSPQSRLQAGAPGQCPPVWSAVA